MINFSSNRTRWIFLLCLSLLGIGLVFLSTARYGGGVAGDSIHYLSVAYNLLRGQGFTDYSGGPLILFPPLFPLVIAAAAWLFRVDVFIAAWVLNALLFGLNIFLSGLFFKRIFETRPLYFYLSSLFVFLSPSALAMHASLLSDPLFLTFTLLFFLLGEDYLQNRSWKTLAGMLVLAGLAPLLRFSGLAHIIAGGLLILFAWRRHWLKALALSGLFGALTILPVALWIALHNLPLSGTWWGTTNAAGADALVNLLQSLRKMLYWFAPYRQFSSNGFAEPVILLVVLMLVLLLINKWKDWRAWAVEFLQPALLSMLLLSAVYYSSTILNMNTADHKSLFSDRYFVIILVPVLALLFISLDRLVLPHLSLRPRTFTLLLCALFLVWSLYPAYKITKYVRESLTDGESGYNQYNTRAFHESETLRQVSLLLQKEPQARLYSNIPPVVWFFTRHSMSVSPAQDVPRTKDQIKTELAGWPYDKPGYYIWFEPDPYKLFMPLNDLYLVADMEMLQKLSDGQIVRVFARKDQ